MNNSKDAMIKDILSIRRRLSKLPVEGSREIEIFEEQISKSLRRIDQVSYLAKKFDRQEIESIQRAYEGL